MGCSERRKEIKQRRQRRKKLAMIKQRVTKATVSEKQHLADKLRRMTPGATVLIESLELAER